MKSLITTTLEALNGSGTPFMLAGSVASGFYSVPRTTNDIDIVIDPTSDSMQRLLGALGNHEWYLDPTAAWRALEHRDMFAVIDTSTGWKVDLIIRKARPFSITEFERRVPTSLFGEPAFIATCEDVILSKLEWASIGGSERQLADVVAIVEIADRLDWEYLQSWASELGVAELLDRVRT